MRAPLYLALSDAHWFGAWLLALLAVWFLVGLLIGLPLGRMMRGRR